MPTTNTRRTIELGLLIASAIPTTLLYALYLMNAHVELSVFSLGVPLGLFVAFAICHIATRIYAPAADPAILPLVFLLSGIGIAFVTRLAPNLAMGQVVWLFVATGALVLTLMFIPSIEELENYKFTIGALGVILLLVPMIFGTERGGSKLWLSLGALSFQPGELSKILLVLFLSLYLAKNREILSASAVRILGLKIPRLRMLLPLFLMWGLSLLVVIFERDLGSALLFFAFFVVMLYVCTGRISYVIISIALLMIGAVLCYHLFSHVQTRVQIWLNPFSDPSNKGLQIVQSLYSLADGGLTGTGIGRGLATLIPVVASDFIFSAIGEEAGLLGASAVLICYILLGIRGLTTAARAKTDVAAFAAAGLSASLVIQAFIIVGGTTKLLPLTGVTLPFISQGGSSLLASFIIVGLLLKAGDEGTGRSSQLKNTEQNLSFALPFMGNAQGKTGSHAQTPKRAHAVFGFSLNTPESGVLGRVALGNRLVNLLGAFCLMFALLIANLTNIQVISAKTFQNMPGNNHTIAKTNHIKRGSIISSDGATLAESVKQDDGSYKRSYPQGSIAAHTLGFVSTRYGTSGVEQRLNDTLVSKNNFSSLNDVLYSLAGSAKTGASAVLTINSQMQKAAEKALQGYKGSVVALNPATGAVLAKASNPTFDLNDLDTAMTSKSADGVLLDRATQVLYTPGSTFKVVTLSAALDEQVMDLNSQIAAPAQTTIGGAEVTNYKHQDLGTITLQDAFKHSSNTAFGQVGSILGPQKLVTYARAFGWQTALGQDFSTLTSLMPDPGEMSAWETAWAACGQPVGMHQSPAGPQSTVMQNAVVAAAIANSGVAMNPYVISHLLTSEGATTAKTQPRILGQAVSADTAAEIKKAMLSDVESGTGAGARVSGVKVAGKTGTAEISDDVSNSLFIGFAPYDKPTVAIAVCLEGSPTQDVHGKAAQVAGKVLAACLNIQALGAAK